MDRWGGCDPARTIVPPCAAAIYICGSMGSDSQLHDVAYVPEARRAAWRTTNIIGVDRYSVAGRHNSRAGCDPGSYSGRQRIEFGHGRSETNPAGSAESAGLG